MSELLVIDIGNTNITLGIFKGKTLGSRWRLGTDHGRMPDEYGLQILGLLQHSGCSIDQLEGVCIASVVPPITGRILRACREYLNQDSLVVDQQTKTGINIIYDDVNTIGADRIVDAVAVYHLYGTPACVVDFGTATTFDAIDKDGTYLGGAIAPGIAIGAQALYERTAKLPRVDLETPPSVIGKNTVHAMQSGLIYGYVSLVEGMVTRFRSVLGEDMKVIATGGLAEVVARETKSIQLIAPWLTLDGLKIIWDMNRGKDA